MKKRRVNMAMLFKEEEQMKITSSTQMFEVDAILNILKKNKITGDEKYKHLVMFGESRANAQSEGYSDFNEFVTTYCHYWGLKK